MKTHPDPVEVLFLESRTTKEAHPQHFEQGKIYELPRPSADRWIGRGVATDDKEKIAAARKAKKPAKSEKIEEKKADDGKPVYRIADLGGGKYDVIDADGAPQNKDPLSKSAAEALFAELSKA
ncbi:MAG: hypothetical protein ACK4NA_12805 [Alphaproteobacteria bacterium]